MSNVAEMNENRVHVQLANRDDSASFTENDEISSVVVPVESKEERNRRDTRNFLNLNTHACTFRKEISEYENDGNCVICIEKLDGTSAVTAGLFRRSEDKKVQVVRKIFKCGHIFHEKCLFDWIKRNLREPKCPLCNQLMNK